MVRIGASILSYAQSGVKQTEAERGMTRRRELYLGEDFGTSVVKAAVVDGEGHLLRTATQYWEALLGSAPQTTGAWWSALVKLVRELRQARVSIGQVAGVAVACAIPSTC